MPIPDRSSPDKSSKRWELPTVINQKVDSKLVVPNARVILPNPAPAAGNNYLCDQCGTTIHVTDSIFRYRDFPFLKDVTEFGIECPNPDCKKFFHSAYSNPELDAERNRVASASGPLRLALAKTYNQHFLEFQQGVMGAILVLKQQQEEARKAAGGNVESEAGEQSESGDG